MSRIFQQGVMIKYSVLAILLFALFFTPACKKENKKDAAATLRALYLKYKDGAIDECQYNGQIVYSAGLNAYDAGTAVYDQECDRIGECNYSFGPVDPICDKLHECKVIYRCKNHISGLPFVDVYDLSK